MTCPQPSHSPEVVRPKGHPCISHHNLGGSGRDRATVLDLICSICTPNHLLGPPIFSSPSELDGTKHIQLVAEIRLPLLRHRHSTKALSEGGTA